MASSGNAHMSQSYLLSRDALGSIRLYAQHWIWRYQLNYLIHPQIPQKDENLKIADVACGTGIWLIETARTLPASAQLDGFDVSPAQFPPKEWLPKNMSLQVLDMLAPVPEELVGKYDIVHVALLLVVVRNENPGQVLENLITLLKPGGYLQWDESDMASMQVIGTDPHNPPPHPRFDEFLKHWTPWLAKRGVSMNWASKLPSLFKSHDLTLISHTRYPIADPVKKVWTDIQITATGEQIRDVLVPSAIASKASKASQESNEEEDDGEPSAEKWLELYDSLVKETALSPRVSVFDMVVVVGQKAV